MGLSSVQWFFFLKLVLCCKNLCYSLQFYKFFTLNTWKSFMWFCFQSGLDCFMLSLDLEGVCYLHFSCSRIYPLVLPVHFLGYSEECFLNSSPIGQSTIVRCVSSWFQSYCLFLIVDTHGHNIYIYFSVRSTFHPCGHHSYQLGSRYSPTCGQLCSYWWISDGLPSWVCVSDTAPVWMG